MDLRQLRTFVVVAEAGGFAAAQQHLRLSQAGGFSPDPGA